MPDLVTHVWFSETVAKELPEEIRRVVKNDLYPFAAAGPDVWFFAGFYGGKAKALAPRGNFMHENRTGAFLRELTRQCRQSRERDALFAYLAGFLCHYCLDKTAHPYIITRTGDYEDTPETLPYRGNHTRLERGIDVYYIRHAYHTTPRDFSLVGRCLPLRSIPKELREDFNAVYAHVYGWEDAWEGLNRSIRDQRLLYRLLQDPLGGLNALTRLIDNGTSHYDYRHFSYFGRDLEESGIDFLNREHRPWANFADPSLVSRESFPELVEKARAEAVDIISKIYNYVYHKTGTPEALAAWIGNASYTSGLDCEDPRNRGPKTFDPMF